MAPTIVDVAPSTVDYDSSRFPDRDESHILAHLRNYCARFEPLPAITVRIDGAKVTVVRGHKYLTIARELGRPTIRAVIDPASADADVERFVARSDVTLLNWERLRSAEEEEAGPLSWHVLYFERPLSRADKEALHATVRAVVAVDEWPVRFEHNDSGPYVAFQAKVPAHDHAWATRFLGALAAFSRERAKIVSYQGRRVDLG